jgi:hypothetical protein
MKYKKHFCSFVCHRIIATNVTLILGMGAGRQSFNETTVVVM